MLYLHVSIRSWILLNLGWPALLMSLAHFGLNPHVIHGEDDRIEERFVCFIERTINKDVSVIVLRSDDFGHEVQPFTLLRRDLAFPDGGIFHERLPLV